MFMTDHELIYGKSAGQSGAYTDPVCAEENKENEKHSSEFMKKTGAANVAAAKFTGKAAIGAAKTASNAAAKFTKNAADYLKSDDAAEKMNSLKSKAKSAASGAGSILSGIKNKASDKISERKKIVRSSDENIPAADEYDAEDNYDVSSDETAYQNDDEYVPDPIADEASFEDVTDESEPPLTEIDNTVQYQETTSAPYQSNNASFPNNSQNQNYQQPQIPVPPQSSTPGYVVQTQKTSPVLIIVIIVIVLVIGVLCGMFFMMSRNDKSDDSSNSIPASDVVETTAEITEAPTEPETQTTTAEKTTANETTSTATTTETPEKDSKTLTAYPESDISKYPQYIRAAENDRDSGLADYYALVDINADNIPELFLTDMDGRIYAIYTAVGNDYAELQRVGGTGRDWITLYNDGCISHGASFGNDGGYTDYEYSGGNELNEIRSYSLDEYNDISSSHGGEASITVSSLANYVTQESDISNKYTTYDTSAATSDFVFFNEPALGIIATQNDPLNLRSMPNSDSEIIIKMNMNSYCSIYGQNSDWCYVSYTENGITYYGYASRQFIGDGGI